MRSVLAPLDCPKTPCALGGFPSAARHLPAALRPAIAVRRVSAWGMRACVGRGRALTMPPPARGNRNAPPSPPQVDPSKGTVSFSAGLQGWAFTLTKFARMYAALAPTRRRATPATACCCAAPRGDAPACLPARFPPRTARAPRTALTHRACRSRCYPRPTGAAARRYAKKFGIDEDKMMAKLWGDNFFNAASKKWQKTADDGAVRAFVQFCIEPIRKVRKRVPRVPPGPRALWGLPSVCGQASPLGRERRRARVGAMASRGQRALSWARLLSARLRGPWLRRGVRRSARALVAAGEGGGRGATCPHAPTG